MKRSVFYYLPKPVEFKPERKLHTVATLVHAVVERVVEFALPTEHKHFATPFTAYRHSLEYSGVSFERQSILVS